MKRIILKPVDNMNELKHGISKYFKSEQKIYLSDDVKKELGDFLYFPYEFKDNKCSGKGDIVITTTSI